MTTVRVQKQFEHSFKCCDNNNMYPETKTCQPAVIETIQTKPFPIRGTVHFPQVGEVEAGYLHLRPNNHLLLC